MLGRVFLRGAIKGRVVRRLLLGRIGDERID